MNIEYSKDKIEELGGKEHLQSILAYKEQWTAEGKQWLCLDIDETLAATNIWRYEKLLEIFGNPEWLTPEQMRDKYHLTQNVPYRQNNPDVEIRMEKHRQDNELQKELPLIENANEIYSRIHENHIPIIAYITARPEAVRQGTIDRLHLHWFPKADLIFRPTHLPHIYSNERKMHVLHLLYPQIQGIVDDNAGLVNYMYNNYPGKIFLYTHEDHSDKWITIIPCKTHEHVKENIKKHL